MRILLIANYWKPWNTPGTFRWLQLSKYINIDVLTSRKPREGFYDETLPRSRSRVFRSGSDLCAFLSGLYLSFLSWFRKYDLYVFTTPPETFIIGAYILQKMGRNVILDMRDTIDRPFQKLKILIPVYRFFYKRVKNKTVSFQFFDETAQVVRSGYNSELEKQFVRMSWEYNYDEQYNEPRMSYKRYCCHLICGYIPRFREKSRDYSSSSFINLLHLGFKGLPKFYHDEVHNQPIISWKESARQYKKIIGRKR